MLLGIMEIPYSAPLGLIMELLGTPALNLESLFEYKLLLIYSKSIDALTAIFNKIYPDLTYFGAFWLFLRSIKVSEGPLGP